MQRETNAYIKWMDTCIKLEYLQPVVVQVAVKKVSWRMQRETNAYIKWMDTCIKLEYLQPVVVQVAVKKVSWRMQRETNAYIKWMAQEKQGVITDLSGIPWLFLPRALARLCAEPNLRGYRKRRWNGVLVRHGSPGVAPALCLVQADVVFTVHIVKIISLNRPITVTGDSFLIVRRGNGV